MPLKHRETGEFYDYSSYESYNGNKTQTLKPWNESLDYITISVSVSDINDDSLTDIEKINLAEKKLKSLIDEQFEYVDIKPVINVSEAPKYIKVVLDMTCPLCGSPLKHDGEALLSNPPQYNHYCSNSDCKYHTRISRWYTGQELYGESVDEVYRIINNGTVEEKEELNDREVIN